MTRSTFFALPVSFLMIAGCGTTDEDVPLDDAGSDIADTATDVRPDLGEDVDPDADPRCPGPNPAESCLDDGCPGAQECVQVEGGCAPSHCSCGDDGWMCTADCGPAYECRNPSPECPTEMPPFSEECGEVGLNCEWGMECCCGECFSSTFCTCTETGWACGATDACMIPSCEGRACDEDSDCDSWSSALECVAGVCAAVTAADWSTGPEIAIVTDCEPYESDGYELYSASVDGDDLLVSVSYSGGCAEHLFRVCWDGSFMESFPVQVRFDLQHEGNDDPCDAYPTEELRIPLTVLRDAYREGYRTEEGTVIIGLGGERIEYAFGPCAGVELPACPPECEEGAFGRCGEACDASVDEACGNEIGDAMACEDGAWVCTVHPPLGPGCNQICRR